MLAFAIVSPATESAPDKDLRRADYATCDLDLRDALKSSLRVFRSILETGALKFR